jgi:transmembrane protein EpsG
LFPLVLLFSDVISSALINIIGSYEEYGHYEEYRPVNFVALMLIVAVFAALRYNKVVVLSVSSKLYYTGFAVAIFFLALVFQVHGYLRVVQYFSIFAMVLIPLILKSFQLSINRKSIPLFAISIITLIVLYLRSNTGVEYKFFWQQMQLGLNYQ